MPTMLVVFKSAKGLTCTVIMLVGETYVGKTGTLRQLLLHAKTRLGFTGGGMHVAKNMYTCINVHFFEK